MPVVERRMRCPECVRNVLARSQRPSRGAGCVIAIIVAALSIFGGPGFFVVTLAALLVVAVLLAVLRGLFPAPFLCPNCGLCLRKAGLLAGLVGAVAVGACVALIVLTLAFVAAMKLAN